MWAALVATAALLTGGCSQIDEPQGSPPTHLPDMELYQSELRFQREGLPRFTVRSGRILRFERKDMMLLDEDVRVDFFDDLGRHSAVLTADEGEVLDKENRLLARGGVVVKSDSGMTLRTEELYYDRSRNRVISDTYVTIITPDDSLSGIGFSSAPDLSDWIIQNTSGTTLRRLENPEGGMKDNEALKNG